MHIAYSRPCAHAALAKRFLQGALTGLTISLLVACGGGGSSGTQESLPAGSGGSLPVSSQPLILSGLATFDYVPSPAGKLVYSQTEARPIRGAALEVVDQNGTVLRRTSTDDQGRYSVSLPADQTIRLRVFAQIDANGATVAVTDNTHADAVYALESPAFASNAGKANLHAASGWTGSGYTESRSAAPFAILDTVYRAQRKVLAVDPAARFKPLSLHWSTANKPSSGDPAVGNIGGTAFRFSANKAAIYILGAADINTDEYDESVIAHEWGHYYQWAFSRDDSPGGNHAGEPLEMTVAFSEGWGNGFSGIVNERGEYSDTQGPGQSSGFWIPLAGALPSMPGWFQEDSVAQIVYQLGQQVGFAPIHQAMQTMANTPAFTSIYAFSDAVRRNSADQGDTIDRLLAAHSIVTSKQAGDPFGTGEINDGGLPIPGVLPAVRVLPVYQPLLLGLHTRACSGSFFGIPNKLGNQRFIRIDAISAGRYRITVQGVTRSDGSWAKPLLSVLENGARTWYDAPASAFYRDIDVQAGPAVLSVEDSDVTEGKVSAGCIDVVITNAPKN
jgi:hypothetical protein